MALSQLTSYALVGMEAAAVTVETHLGPGLPAFQVVGLPEATVREARDRVRSAICNSGFSFPQQRITVNLAPADLPKHGGRFDLAMALGILVASRQVPAPERASAFLGELALGGSVRGVQGVIAAALRARQDQRQLVLASDNAAEAALCNDGEHRQCATLAQACAWLAGHTTLDGIAGACTDTPADESGPCLSQVRGQPLARRALEVAAAGGHSMLLCGPPGSGKSMLATRLPGLLPRLNRQQALEVAAIHSLKAPRDTGQFWTPPLRQPHHTASPVAMAGGGSQVLPGEISLAHNGVLFLDELPEFDRRVLEVLREPLETGRVHLSRAARQARYPAQFQLVCAMNPCPCGYFGDPARSCGYQCEKARRYQGRLSGPLLDRLDMRLDVAPLDARALLGAGAGEDSATVRERVAKARQQQAERQGVINARLPRAAFNATVSQHQAWLVTAMDRLGLSARALVRLLRVSRTLADLAGSAGISQDHLEEALLFRQDGVADEGQSSFSARR
jgi:magnesium chelatase family protein